MLKLQRHLRAGLMSFEVKATESSIALPLLGSPVVFHVEDAETPHFWKIEFKALTVTHTHLISNKNVKVLAD